MTPPKPVITQSIIRLVPGGHEVRHYSEVVDRDWWETPKSEEEISQDFERLLATEPVSKFFVKHDAEIPILRLPPIGYQARLLQAAKVAAHVFTIPRGGHDEQSTSCSDSHQTFSPDQ